MKSVTLNVDFVDLSTTWKEKQTKENKKTPQSTNVAHKSLRQVRFSVGWEPGDEGNFQ